MRSAIVRNIAISLAAVSLSGCSYKRFVGQEQAIKAEWAQVQNELQRRNDLVPNLVEAVQVYASHEQSMLQAVADSRVRLEGARTAKETIAAANQQSTALGRLLPVVENYPEIKADEPFNRMMDELAAAENRIAVERMRYNARVQEYKTSRRQPLGVVTALLFDFKDYPFFLVEVPAMPREGPPQPQH